jgi:kynurenine formamidase
MIAEIIIDNKTVSIDFSKPLDISLPLKASQENPVAWYLDSPKIYPVTDGNWIAKVSEGASVNFNSIEFNPHAHGTHTECIGHITKDFFSVNKQLKKYLFLAEVLSVTPQKNGADFVITKEMISKRLENKSCEALVIRTLPNTAEKKHKKYSHTNWPYLDEKAALYIREKNITHLLIDTPSVDKEKDDGKLLAHKAFWDYPKNPRLQATITEFIFVANTIQDGSYLLNLMIAPFCNDASPSKPVLYKIQS